MKTSNGISQRIKDLRKSRGLSKSELARKTGVTPTAVWNWEDTEVVPRGETFGLVAQALGVSETYLRTGEGSAASAAPLGRTVATIIEEARNEIAAITGITVNNVRLNVEFVSN